MWKPVGSPSGPWAQAILCLLLSSPLSLQPFERKDKDIWWLIVILIQMRRGHTSALQVALTLSAVGQSVLFINRY